MSAVLREVGPAEGPLDRFRRAVGQDLALLARLHDRELDRPLVLELWSHCYEDFLALKLDTKRGRSTVELFREGLTEIPAACGPETLDRLAADFAGIYLTYGFRASPCESVWLDEDHLTMQEPMFGVRDWYRRHGLGVEDWRQRTDDHLVNQLLFIAHLITEDAEGAGLEEAARFMDEHLLRWIEDFALRVASRCETSFYAGVVLLTAAYVDELRDLLAQILETPRPTSEEIAERLRANRPAPVEVEGPYVPGVAPSW